jgi:hypothetical protein
MSGPVASGEEDESYSVPSSPSWKKSAGVPTLLTLLSSVLSDGDDGDDGDDGVVVIMVVHGVYRGC